MGCSQGSATRLAAKIENDAVAVGVLRRAVELAGHKVIRDDAVQTGVSVKKLAARVRDGTRKTTTGSIAIMENDIVVARNVVALYSPIPAPPVFLIVL